MPYIDGVWKTRRPVGHRNDPEVADPDTRAMTFLYSEDAWAVAHALDGWERHVQFMGVWDRWIVELNRKSWPSGRYVVLLKDGTVGKPSKV